MASPTTHLSRDDRRHGDVRTPGPTAMNLPPTTEASATADGFVSIDTSEPAPRAAPATPVLELAGIGKRFGAIDVLRDVRLRLYPGEIHALMGQNGAGKSTLIKVLTGVFPASAGEVPMILATSSICCGLRVNMEKIGTPDGSFAKTAAIGAHLFYRQPGAKG